MGQRRKEEAGIGPSGVGGAGMGKGREGGREA